MKQTLLLLMVFIGTVTFAQTQRTMPEPVSEAMKIEMTRFVPVQYLSKKFQAEPSAISQKLGDSYAAIMVAMENQKVKQMGPVFAIYHTESSAMIEITAAIPCNQQVVDQEDIMAGNLNPGKTVVAHFYGDYSRLPEGHTALKQYLSSHGLTSTGLIWEQYVTDPTVETNPAKWLTNIYYEVK